MNHPKPEHRTITLAEHTAGWVYSEDINDGRCDDGGYFENIEALVQRCLDKEQDLPDEVKGCIEVPFRIYASSMLDRECENQVENGDLYEDARETFKAAEVEELQTILDAWCKRADIITQTPNEYLTITIGDDVRADFEKRRAGIVPPSVTVNGTVFEGPWSSRDDVLEAGWSWPEPPAVVRFVSFRGGHANMLFISEGQWFEAHDTDCASGGFEFEPEATTVEALLAIPTLPATARALLTAEGSGS